MTTQKKILIGAGLLAFSAGVYFLIRTPKNMQNSSNYIDAGEDVNHTPIFSPTLKAKALYEAMNQVGTDEDAIFSELTGVTQAQFGLIVQKFGLKNYNAITGRDDWGGAKRSLKMWLKYELSETDYNRLKSKYPMYL